MNLLMRVSFLMITIFVNHVSAMTIAPQESCLDIEMKLVREMRALRFYKSQKWKTKGIEKTIEVLNLKLASFTKEDRPKKDEILAKKDELRAQCETFKEEVKNYLGCGRDKEIFLCEKIDCLKQQVIRLDELLIEALGN